jgi:asparagine synthase (glutamine-hydrolysing)
LPGDILVKADRATMAYSLESRSPLLDYRLAELAARIRPGWKVRGTNGKYVFKEAMAPYVPPPVLARSKMGFVAPLAQWMRTSLKPVFERMVLCPEMEQYLALGQVRRLWREHQSGYSDHGRPLWSLLMLACWRARWTGAGRESEALASCLRPVP